MSYLGDHLSLGVLECLNRIAELYGDQFILVQYFPYCWDLVGMCKVRLNPCVEPFSAFSVFLVL
jgi:WD repeat-containing protein 81